MAESRTQKTICNTAFAFVYQLSDIVFNFILRTIFIYTLGKTYLGLNGLFSNILTVLSFMDMGIGGAISFCLYRPLSENNYGKVKALMRLYQKVYTVIGIFVCCTGFTLTPFLKYIINLPNNIPNLYGIYWLTIGNTAISYFLAYRRSLLIADQRTDINIKNQLIFRGIRFVLLSATLLWVKSYIVYLAFDVANTLFSNIHITWLVKRRYRKIEEAESISISSEEKRQIVQYVSSGIFTKFGQTIVNCTDSIIISMFVSTVLVGIYSNYSMITSSLDVAVYLLFSGITASIGNFAVEKNSFQAKSLFKRLIFGNYLIVFFLTVELFSLINPFISIWAGKDYLLSNLTVSVISLNFYIASLQKSVECFMGANGEMYYINRYRSLIEGIVNLAISLLLVRNTNLGITGVFLGTTACFVVGRLWMDAFVLYKYWFMAPFKEYVQRYILQVLLTAVVSIACKSLVSLVFSKLGLNIGTWILAGLIIAFVVFLVAVLFFGKKEDFLYYKELMRKMVIYKLKN